MHQPCGGVKTTESWLNAVRWTRTNTSSTSGGAGTGARGYLVLCRVSRAKVLFFFLCVGKKTGYTRSSCWCNPRRNISYFNYNTRDTGYISFPEDRNEAFLLTLILDAPCTPQGWQSRVSLTACSRSTGWNCISYLRNQNVLLKAGDECKAHIFALSFSQSHPQGANFRARHSLRHLVYVSLFPQSSPSSVEQYMGLWPNITIHGRRERFSGKFALCK